MAGDGSSCVCKAGASPSGSGWLCLARSALATVVTVLAAVVIVMGLLLVLQPGTTIQLNIAQSDVFLIRDPATTPHGTTSYRFRFYLEAHNPSEVLFISYRNVTVQLYDTSSPDIPLIACFGLDPSYLSLSQTEEQEFFIYVVVDNVTTHAVERLFKVEEPSVIEGAVMVLSGDLSVANDINKWGGPAFYGYTRFICEPVAVKSKTPLPEPSSQNIKAGCVKA